jgi:hypothetical protein
MYLNCKYPSGKNIYKLTKKSPFFKIIFYLDHNTAEYIGMKCEKLKKELKYKRYGGQKPERIKFEYKQRRLTEIDFMRGYVK